ncbi:DUF4267 domain-containing protein [Nocardia sp. NEAU-G5]|uniref:DUF4267 domain-containing protein n=1 Tax=Nocardia albiluteola TaxID=2842303 RepID=A0ABS6AZV9_9NOCA|nr:DUF4267 domain-containing protein [Nocardia albiluteola]MBU3063588.1 DUF4267 domain-containing protein [Nocardia albiluteola]
MQNIIGSALAALIGVAVFVMGARFITNPVSMAGFGIPNPPVHDTGFLYWLRVKGIRDAAPGLIIFLMLAAGTPTLLGGVVLALACIPIADALIVLRSGGPKAVAYGVHAATAAVMVIDAAVLLTV